MDDLVRKAADAGFRSFGVVGDVAPWGIKNDEDLRRFIDEVKDYPCLMGLRPAEPGWSANLSAELVGQVDYVLMAKQAGVKFTFGSDTRDHRTFRLDYCKQIASLCGLTEADFYIPVRKAR